MNLVDLLGKRLNGELLSAVDDYFGPLRRPAPHRGESFFSWIIVFARNCGLLSLSEDEEIEMIHLEADSEEFYPDALATIHSGLHFGVSRETIRERLGPPESYSEKFPGWSGAKDSFTIGEFELNLEYDVHTDCLSQVSVSRPSEDVTVIAEDEEPDICDDEVDLQELIERTTSRSPRGLKNLKCERAELDVLPECYVCHTTWDLACQCSSKELSLRFDASRLTASCGKCERQETFFDSSIHGITGELDLLESASSEATSDIPSMLRQCGNCDSTRFFLTLTFGYMDLDLQEDEPELPAWDFFHSLLAHGKCVECSRLSMLATVSTRGNISLE